MVPDTEMPPTHVTGWVYVLVNETMPKLAKIGFTLRRVEERVVELSAHTGVPSPFVCAFRCNAERPAELEAKVHAHLNDQRHDKEFFRISPYDASIAIESVAKQMQITTSDGWLSPRYSRIESRPEPRLSSQRLGKYYEETNQVLCPHCDTLNVLADDRLASFKRSSVFTCQKCRIASYAA